MNPLQQMPKSFNEQTLDDACIEDLMIALSLKCNGSVHVNPDQGDGQKLMTSLPNVGDEHQGQISKCVSEGDKDDPRSWKSYMYY